ncbi:ATP-binding protein [Rhodocyclus tenuis]|uniref:ATP-binding protein n=1 Tax=Rhodocyclus tenuis TaxID=1066 RepID=UPI0019089BF3|nr:ATP-binding protein [Rhodocyclus tenuis]MBK1680368.1 hypothetical protein [Rhodocyclus tenuis]
MNLLPASLAGRTLLLVLAVVVVAATTIVSLIGEVRRSAHVAQTTQLVAGQIRLLQTVLPGLDASARERLARLPAGDGPQLQLMPDGPGVPSQEPDFGFGRRLAETLSEQLGEPISLRHINHPRGQPPQTDSSPPRGEPRPRSGLWIGFMAGSERWWLLLPPPRFEPPELPPQLWAGLALALALLAAIATIFVRGIVGPLARLGEAVDAAGDGAGRPVVPAGPSEVRHLAERHNGMLARLAAADAERREMLAGLTHDLRAPLARLRLRLALLASDEERAGLTRDADDMERIVSQCLAFLRSEAVAGTAPPLPIAAAISEAVARQQELGRPVTLRADAASADCRVAIDAAALQRVLDNLIDNALQHAAPPVELSLSVLSAAASPKFCLCVRDHGPGIAAADRERVLDAFTQLEPARATSGRCGLGLAIVRCIVAGCGGELTLRDAEDGGLVVHLRLPCTWPGGAVRSGERQCR